jgi:hypothetical protein
VVSLKINKIRPDELEKNQLEKMIALGGLGAMLALVPPPLLDLVVPLYSKP